MSNKNILLLYAFISLVFLAEVVLSLNHYSFSGYYTDKIINWMWLAMTLLIILRFWRKKVVKAYFAVLIFSVLLSMLPMMIPFFALVNYFSTLDDYQQIQLDKIYRIERTRRNVLDKPKVYIYKNEGIVEKEIYKVPYLEIVEKVFQDHFTNDIAGEAQPIQKAKLVSVDKDSLGIEYEIMNKKNIFYHKDKKEESESEL
ncbi:hypothetical protein EGY07_17690 [Chryseobacterium indologenes]|uniref:Uncharacterized protein n=1 Tax=Chryseobacterium indologenes TaxID=253 RepID=A0AAD0YV08_CHRID|nr:hypothetical protein [Chryseobacterium indologenes]ASE63843.1 hypothetical protein CEQ15_21350 [Chryseobacterium indologenes]ATN07835.1 hypothetical protein CRN76_21785 [Chryseobacterium indologenes]AYY83428.1 hypothetical protein EGX91_02060 [Chryseobacterium indologenes]AYZ37238.1 hypothetical protein EGY07_17690 [Chryseobacterium indologenes]AZB19549.1 hypothetical protein EG352_18090 [Chryseobacterium indologenes]